MQSRPQRPARKAQTIDPEDRAEQAVVGTGDAESIENAASGISRFVLFVLCAGYTASVLRVWIDRIPGLPVTPLLYPNFGEERQGRQLFQRAFGDFRESLVEVADHPEKADIFLLAHNYPLVCRNAAYLRRFAEISRRYGKRIVVFWHGDGTEAAALPNAVVFRTSQYKSKLRPGEFIMPAYSEDLSQSHPAEPRMKHEGPPIAGFCGWATFKDLRNALGTFLRAFPYELLSVTTRNPRWRSRQKGIWLRRKLLRLLGASRHVQPNFILRSSHSAHSATIRLDPAVARREYIGNMRQSDLALCLRGDGNYSLRFYEALSLGRVPLLLDTDCALPLEDRIDYSSFTVRVPIGQLGVIDRIVSDIWNRLTPEAFEAMQRRARESYERYLSAPAYLRYAVEHLFP